MNDVSSINRDNIIINENNQIRDRNTTVALTLGAVEKHIDLISDHLNNLNDEQMFDGEDGQIQQTGLQQIESHKCEELINQNSHVDNIDNIDRKRGKTAGGDEM